MKKADFPLAKIIFVFLFMIIILLLIYKAQLSEYVKKNILKIQTPEEETAAIEGATKKTVPTEKTSIPANHDQALQQLISEIVTCWRTMKAGKIQNYRHKQITLPKMAPGITKSELITEIKKYDTDAADVFESDWGDPYEKGNTLAAGTYILCCDYDKAADSDIYLTKDLTFKCE